MSGAAEVRIVARLLLAAGVISLFLGFVIGGALGRDVPTNGTLRQVALGPTLLLTGTLALFAWRRNVRLEGRGFGMAALAALGGTGLAFFGPVNPYTLLMLYGMAVYLSPRGRAAFPSPNQH